MCEPAMLVAVRHIDGVEAPLPKGGDGVSVGGLSHG